MAQGKSRLRSSQAPLFETVSRIMTNTKAADANAIHATELIAISAPNRSARNPIPMAPKTNPKSRQNL